MHPRTEIRNILTGAIRSANIPEVNGRIFETRARPLNENELPAIMIYFLGERITGDDTAPPVYSRTLNFVIEVLVRVLDRDSETADDLADKISRDIETALLSSNSIITDINGRRTGPISKIFLAETQQDIDKAEFMTISQKLRFEVLYIEDIFGQEAPDDFLRFNAVVNGPADNENKNYNIEINGEF